MSELIKHESLALVPRGLAEAEQMAKMLSQSALLPAHFHGKPADVFMALAYGLEIGMTPVNALQSIYVVHGRPGMYSDAMVALVLSSGLCKYFRTVEADGEHATCETHRHGAPEPSIVTITIDQAKDAGWYGSNKKYQSEPHRMLAARAKSTLCKDVYPDVLRGMVSVEELRDETTPLQHFSPPPTVGQIIDVEPEPEQAPNGKAEQERGPVQVMAQRIVSAATEAELKSIGEDMKAVIATFEEGHANELRTLYSQHKTRLRKQAEDAAEASA